jgi:DNA-directed RNA polymerase specialized sigma24 family protein
LKTTLEIIYDKHNDWVSIVRSFGCNKDTAEDIVQETYIKLSRIINSGANLMYNETEINYYYVFRTLRSMFLDLKRKESKAHLVGFDPELDKRFVLQNNDQDIDKIYNEILGDLKKMHWYDRKIFEYIDEGESITGLSKKTDISYYSVYNTYKKVLETLKNKL